MTPKDGIGRKELAAAAALLGLSLGVCLDGFTGPIPASAAELNRPPVTVNQGKDEVRSVNQYKLDTQAVQGKWDNQAAGQQGPGAVQHKWNTQPTSRERKY